MVLSINYHSYDWIWVIIRYLSHFAQGTLSSFVQRLDDIKICCDSPIMDNFKLQKFTFTFLRD